MPVDPCVHTCTESIRCCFTLQQYNQLGRSFTCSRRNGYRIVRAAVDSSLPVSYNPILDPFYPHRGSYLRNSVPWRCILLRQRTTSRPTTSIQDRAEHESGKLTYGTKLNLLNLLARA